MCLGIPAKIIEIKNDVALVEIGGVIREASLQLVKGTKLGQYVILHAGFAISILDEEEAKETLKYLREIGEV